MNLPETVRRNIPASLAGKRLMVAVSGGADSVALLRVLHTLELDIVALHCNFHLRGEESNRDQRFVEDLCHRLGIQLETIDFDVEKFRRDQPRPVSVEMACRQLRYDWFERMRVEHEASAIAVAHNADDNVETLLLNLMRGTGIAGLTGMAVLSDNLILRPMLSVRRSEIESYLASLNQDYIVDSTNLENEYRRNRIRNRLIPVMTELFPGAVDGILKTIEALLPTELTYREAVEGTLEAYLYGDNSLYLKELTESGMTDEQIALMLFEWYREKGLTMSQARKIAGGVGKSGNRFPLRDGELIVNRDMLIYQPSDSGSSNVLTLKDVFEMDVIPPEDFRVERNPRCACFDAAILDRELSVRTWQEGDRMKPFGMKNSRKLSDIFSDAKIPVNEKRRIPLLVCDDEIIWVAGVKNSDCYRVNSDSKSVVRFRLK